MELSRLEEFVISCLRPFIRVRHIAFIMDGNRRYARMSNLELSQGHLKGINKLISIVKICSKLNISTVTVYGFSLFNFYRSHEEISNLFNAFVETISPTGTLRDLCMELQCRIRFCGDLKFLGSEMGRRIKEIEDSSSLYDRIKLNVCVSYGSRNEMVKALSNTSEAGHGDRIRAFYGNLYTGLVEPPDILLRTSGVTRLSDFLCYQVSDPRNPKFCSAPSLPPFTSCQRCGPIYPFGASCTLWCTILCLAGGRRRRSRTRTTARSHERLSFVIWGSVSELGD